jgi:lysine 2,3-aminomutase
MAKKDRFARRKTKVAGPRTEGPTSWYFRNFSHTEEGAFRTPLCISTIQELSQLKPIAEEVSAVSGRVADVYPFKVSRHFLELADFERPLCPIRAQFLPSAAELDKRGVGDPLSEAQVSATPILLKRYAGRAVLLATADCAMYCRFCNRKRLVGRGWDAKAYWEETLSYLERDRQTGEIIVSGGDPLTLDGPSFSYLLERLRSIRHIGTLRVSTRVPAVDPGRLSPDHLKALKSAGPLWVVLHINHPRELSPACREAVRRLRETGNPLVSQTVLLRGVNDCPHVLKALWEGLVRLGVKPYYLFQLDEVEGAHHFKVKIGRGLEIMERVRTEASGLAVPRYIVDLAGGPGKVPAEALPRSLSAARGRHAETLSGWREYYSDDGEESRCVSCGICGVKGQERSF